MAFIYIYFFFEKVGKIDNHSNFNFECNTERGFKDSLSIALGSKVLYMASSFWLLKVISRDFSQSGQLAKLS
jgi:hypothetical protein